MKENAGVVYDDVKKCVDEVINYVGKDITFAMTLALGKPYRFINELYRRAKEDPTITLKIVTALPLEKPRGHTDLEKKFLKPLSDRVFDGVPEFDYMVDYRAGKLPKNVSTYEFFSKAGAELNNPESQQNHLASNYTHVVRDAMDFGVNVFGQLIGYLEKDGKTIYSMGCNTDICIGGVAGIMQKRAAGEKVAIIGEANKNMPFLYGDAVIEADTYDIILQGPEYDYELFCPPKDAVALPDYSIGLHVSTLIRDGGTIQIGIGALGDAIVAGLLLRNEHNDVYKEILNKAGILKRYEKLISKWGDTSTFKKGLYGSSEMFVDPFLQMYKSGILKRKVYDSVPLMKMINSEYLAPDRIPEDIIDQLIEMKAIHSKMHQDDFDFLTHYGILKSGLRYENGNIIDGDTVYSGDLSDDNNLARMRNLLGKELKNGMVILGAFFLGPKAFYKALNEMSEEERSQFGMSGVEKVNQLYGGEELRTLQRKDGRFVNAGMKATLLGAIASDQLEDGRVVSGIGGQYNFVAMGHALEDGRVIMMIRSTKGSGKMLRSNIVFSYGHCSVPKHLRDIIVTEYGIADVRGKPEKDVIAAILNVTDSRFQQELLEQAKKAGKIPMDYEIPAEYRNNYPEKIAELLNPYKQQGYFQPFPFGTDLMPEEVALGGSLKGLKALSTGDPVKLYSGILKELFKPIPEAAEPYIKRMDLENPSTIKEKVMRKMVVFALRNAGRL
ncbi:MAG: acetyl-CoA hydrolase/transferase C-terminal domain-containing protein [Candidatus Saccharibacteria bacterium]